MILPQVAENLTVTNVLASNQQITTNLTAEHQAQILARGINLAWVIANCKSFDTDTATLMLGYKALSAGIMLMSDEYGQWQFRPDEPWASKDGKKPKYRTPK